MPGFRFHIALSDFLQSLRAVPRGGDVDLLFWGPSALESVANPLPSPLMRTKSLALTVTLLALSALNPQLSTCFAATRTWDGGGANNNWSTAANWDAAAAAGDDLVFPGGAGVDATSLSNTNDFTTVTPFKSITISGTNYTLRGNTIILTNGITHTSGGTNTVAAGIQLGQDETFTATAASGRLIVSGAVVLNGHSLSNNANTGAIEISGAIATVGNVIKNGAGTLRFSGSGNNTYSGDTQVNDGLLELSKTAGTLAISGALIIGDGSGAVGSAVGRLFASNQISDTSAVSIK